VRKLLLISVAAILFVGAYAIAHWQQFAKRETNLVGHQEGHHANRGLDVGDASLDSAKIDSLPALDAHGSDGIREISKAELVKLMRKFRPLSQDENANLNRGCPGFTCVYQGLGLTRWPELANGMSPI